MKGPCSHGQLAMGGGGVSVPGAQPRIGGAPVDHPGAASARHPRAPPWPLDVASPVECAAAASAAAQAVEAAPPTRSISRSRSPLVDDDAILLLCVWT
jgi:hypothetical protein